VTVLDERTRQALVRRGFALEWATLSWNVAGIVVLAVAAVAARSVALAGFGLDSLIEIGASTVVIWELSGTGVERQRRGLRLIGYAFAALAIYLLVQSTVVLATGYHPRHSPLGIGWTAATAVVMFALAAGKARTGRALNNPVLLTEGRVTVIDGILAVAVLLGLILNAAARWWWADPAAGYVLVYYAAREVREIFSADSLCGVPNGPDVHDLPVDHGQRRVDPLQVIVGDGEVVGARDDHIALAAGFKHPQQLAVRRAQALGGTHEPRVSVGVTEQRLLPGGVLAVVDLLTQDVLAGGGVVHLNPRDEDRHVRRVGVPDAAEAGHRSRAGRRGRHEGGPPGETLALVTSV
jgi:Cation efflux family